MWKFFFFTIVTIVLILFVLPRGGDTSSYLRSMPEEDKQILSDFFSELIEHNCFGHTLLGTKPVSFETSFIAPPCGSDVFTSNRASFFIRRAEKVWRKYVNKFHQMNFVLKFSSKKNTIVFFLINKLAFIETVKSNLSVFRAILGEATTPEQLLDRISREETDWNEELHHSAVLEGILLGFGTKNSITYGRYQELLNALGKPLPPPWCEEHDPSNGILSQSEESQIFLNKKWREVSCVETSHLVKPSSGFSTIEDEYCWFRKKYRAGRSLLQSSNLLSRFPIPVFLVDGQDDEICQIIVKYKKDRKDLARLYASGDFLENTIKKLTGEL